MYGQDDGDGDGDVVVDAVLCCLAQVLVGKMHRELYSVPTYAYYTKLGTRELYCTWGWQLIRRGLCPCPSSLRFAACSSRTRRKRVNILRLWVAVSPGNAEWGACADRLIIQSRLSPISDIASRHYHYAWRCYRQFVSALARHTSHFGERAKTPKDYIVNHQVVNYYVQQTSIYSSTTHSFHCTPRSDLSRSGSSAAGPGNLASPRPG